MSTKPIKFEMMVTRRKSAQLKRQLRDKDRSMRRITQLLRSPNAASKCNKTCSKTKKTSPKTSPKPSPKKQDSAEKLPSPKQTSKSPKTLRKAIEITEIKEFYPKNLKRNLKNKKISLNPPSNLKIIGDTKGTKKRKLCLPQKGVKSPCFPRSDHCTPSISNSNSPVSDLTIEEIIRMRDETLTDDDFMEILTCPSPVWWEEPPDEQYDEDAIHPRLTTFRKPINNKDTLKEESTEQKQSTNEQINVISNVVDQIQCVNKTFKDKFNKSETDTNTFSVPEISTKKYDAAFLKKRNILENIISGCVKQVTINESLQNNDCQLFINEKAQNVGLSNNVGMCANEKNTLAQCLSPDIKNEMVKSEIDISKTRRELDTKERNSNSESDRSSDFSLQDCEFLKHLENIEIPTLNESTCESQNGTEEITGIPIVDKNSDILVKSVSDHEMKTDTSMDLEDLIKTNIVDKEQVKEANVTSGETKTTIVKNAQKTTVTASNNNIIQTKHFPLTSYMTVKTVPNQDNIPVYYAVIDDVKSEIQEKIIDECETKDDANICPTKINNYFKKCKKIHKVTKFNAPSNGTKHSTSIIPDTQSNENKSIVVSKQTSMKYCKNCSSIFDTEYCTYCMRLEKRKADEEADISVDKKQAD